MKVCICEVGLSVESLFSSSGFGVKVMFINSFVQNEGPGRGMGNEYQ